MVEQEKTPIEKRDESLSVERTRNEPSFTPDVDIFETDGELLLLADMPGVRRENADIDLSGGVLTISGRVEPRTLTSGFTCISSEFQAGGFVRSFTLGEEIDSSKIEASMTRGVLRVRLPKQSPAVRKIVVKEG